MAACIWQGVWGLQDIRDNILDGNTQDFSGTPLWVWGCNGNGQLAQENIIDYSSPVQIPGTNWCKVVFNTHMFGLKTNCTLWGWGGNSFGALGQNNITDYSSPVQVPGTSWCDVAVAAGGQTINALKDNCTFWSLGRFCNGLTAVNDGNQYSSPVQIPGTTWSRLVCTGIAFKTDNTLWKWGTGTSGALGDGFAVNRSSPVQIPGTTWSTVDNCYGLKTDCTLWRWGNSNAGSIGDGFNIPRSSPTQVPGITWCKADCRWGLKTDGTLWVWGCNQRGVTAQGGTTLDSYSSPVQVSGITWCNIALNDASAAIQIIYGIKTDNTLWVWGGLNCTGLFGLNSRNTTINYSSPLQIPGTTWSCITADTADNVVARKTDGTLWMWGCNTAGQVGQNTINPARYSSPVQIPGTTWSNIGCTDSQRSIGCKCPYA